MSLKFGEPPNASVTTLAQDLTRFAGVSGGADFDSIETVRESAAAASPVALLPHEVFALELNDIRAGQGIAAARPVAWRYLIGTESGSPQVADVRAEPGGIHALEAVRGGSTPVQTLNAVERLQRDPRVEGGSYEMRLLLFPAARLRSLWLADLDVPDHGRDLFYLLNNPMSPTQLPSETLLDYPSMLEWLRQLAVRVDTRDPDRAV